MAIGGSLALVVHEPVAFRGTILIAALHYCQKMGGTLQSFEPTFLFHKGECIRMVNEWLNDPEARTDVSCLEMITTLCMVEVGGII
jgi:hypothetical protein